VSGALALSEYGLVAETWAQIHTKNKDPKDVKSEGAEERKRNSGPSPSFFLFFVDTRRVIGQEAWHFIRDTRVVTYSIVVT
jgi:hypothetical protein